MQAKPIVIGIGEVLWDNLPGGAIIGGAPANFAFHVRQLGGEGVLVSRCGSGKNGQLLRRALRAKGIEDSFIQRDDEHQTGAADVSLTHGEPTYVFRPEPAWDYLELTEEVLTLARKAQALCFGSLAQRHPVARRTIQAVVEATGPECLRCFDVNLREPHVNPEAVRFGLQNATLLKATTEELEVLQSMVGCDRAEFFHRFPLRWMVETRGARGCCVHTRDSRVEIPAETVRVVDAVGAGDAFTATFVMALLAGYDVPVAARHSNRVAAFVVGRPGAMPEHESMQELKIIP